MPTGYEVPEQCDWLQLRLSRGPAWARRDGGFYMAEVVYMAEVENLLPIALPVGIELPKSPSIGVRKWNLADSRWLGQFTGPDHRAVTPHEHSTSPVRMKTAERDSRARLYRTLGFELLRDPAENQAEAQLQLHGGGGIL